MGNLTCLPSLLQHLKFFMTFISNLKEMIAMIALGEKMRIIDTAAKFIKNDIKSVIQSA